jgi:hypothetical protein
MKSLVPFTLALVALNASLAAQTTLPAPAAAKIKVPALSKNAGTALAMNETYILSGSKSSPNGSFTDAGDVLVFRVSDGSFVRRLASFFPATGGSFGHAVALYGNIAYVGASGESPSPSLPNSGAIYAFDIPTGKVLWVIPGQTGQKLGSSISISGDLMAVGGYSGQLAGAPSGSGSVAIIDRKTASEVWSIKLSTPAASDWFGYSVALQGRLLAAGAPLRTAGGLQDAGEVLLIDVISGQIIKVMTAGNVQTGAQFGLSVALCKDVLVVGAPHWDNGGSTDAGFVHLFNSDGTGRPNPYLSTPYSSKQFGRSLAAAGNMVLVGGVDTTNGGEAFLFDVNDEVADPVEVAPHTSADAQNFGCAVALTEQALAVGDNLQPITGSTNQGAIWLARSVRQRLSPRFRYGMTNDIAPGTSGARYASFADATLLENSATIMFRAGLKGTGVTTANNSAVFNDWSTSLPELIVRKGDKIGGKSVSSLGQMFFAPSNSAWPVFQSTVGGVTSWMRDDGTSVTSDLRVGAAPANPATEATIGSIRAVTCAASADGTATFVYAGKTGVGGTTSANDSRIALYERNLGSHEDSVREGYLATPDSRLYGQFSARIAAGPTHFVFHNTLTGTSTGNTAVFVRKNGTPTVLVAQKGTTAPGTTATFTTFLGEGINSIGSVIFRATTSAATEGLWTKTTAGTLSKLIVKGDIATGAPSGVKFSRFTRFFIADNGDALFTAVVTGPGVTTANDQGVWLRHGGSLEMLLREGDPAPDCDGARIGAISGVDFGTQTGCYTILTSLTGSTSTNQAVFYGDSSLSNEWARRPLLNLRKGTWIDKPGGQRITSLAFTAKNVDPSGSGSKGNVRLVSDEGSLVKITYSDALQELMTIRP